MSGAFRRFGPESPFDDPFGHMRATARSFLGHTTSLVVELGEVRAESGVLERPAAEPSVEAAQSTPGRCSG